MLYCGETYAQISHHWLHLDDVKVNDNVNDKKNKNKNYIAILMFSHAVIYKLYLYMHLIVHGMVFVNTYWWNWNRLISALRIWCHHFDKILSLSALQVFIVTISGATKEENFINLRKHFCFHD